jgi:hypothetical protein
MHTAHTRLLPALALLLLAGCPAPPPAGDDDLAGPASDAPVVQPDGPEPDLAMTLACGQGTCAGDQICAGAPGCKSDWACAAAPRCTKDLVPYCGCDGKTFRGSGNCPGQPYLRRGECDGACLAQEARGVGPCDAVLGVFFDGRGCRAQSGCTCEGRDCKSAYPSLMTCQEAHAGCGGARADGMPCSRGEQCQSSICEGMGCGPDEARCVPKGRGCTRDLVEWCSCEGRTFRASGTCPGRPYKHKGPC